MPEISHGAHQAGIQRYLATGEARVIGQSVELVGRRKDGGEFPIELSLASWSTQTGVFFTGILRDITARKRVEEALARERNLLRSLLDNIPDHIFVKDAQCRYI